MPFFIDVSGRKSMGDRVRLDRFLAEEGLGTRTEVKKMIRAARVQVNGAAARQSDQKIDPDTDVITADGKEIRRTILPTLMLNKPAGVVSATQDARERTVLDLIQEPWAKELFPVGRLDKDTEGLLLLTSDGKMCHELLSPKKHVKKTYFAVVSGTPDPELIERFHAGIDIGEKRLTLPAELVFLDGTDECCTLVTIMEGKFHQIKRMFAAVGREVRYLKRLSMGGLVLDPALAPGQYRPLTQEELNLLTNLR